MNPINMTPDSTVLQQVDGQWQKLAAMLLWKLVGRDKCVTLTHADIERFSAEFAPGMPVMFTHGHSDSIDFTVVDESAAKVLAAHDATLKGTA
jgi:hypothetical protein